VEHLSLKWLHAEGLEGGLLYWKLWVMKERLWRWTSLFMGAQLGNLEWAHLLGTFERWLKGALRVEHLSLYGSSVKGTWREGSLAETLEDR
jgi:hypothetical protein